MNASLTSKHLNTNVLRATGYEDRASGKFIPVLDLRPGEPNEEQYRRGRVRFSQLVQQLHRRILTNPNFRHQYQHASMMDCHEFAVPGFDIGPLGKRTDYKSKELLRWIFVFHQQPQSRRPVVISHTRMS